MYLGRLIVSLVIHTKLDTVQLTRQHMKVQCLGRGRTRSSLQNKCSQVNGYVVAYLFILRHWVDLQVLLLLLPGAAAAAARANLYI